jgi:hypothetical protein
VKVMLVARSRAVTGFPQPLKARPVFSEAKTSVLVVAGCAAMTVFQALIEKPEC